MLALMLYLLLQNTTPRKPNVSWKRIEKEISALEVGAPDFERHAPRSQVQHWQKLQAQLSPAQDGYMQLCFALAYYGVDYNVNFQRIRRLCREWQAGVFWHKYKTLYKDGTDSLDWNFVPIYLMWLYNHNHRLEILQTFLDNPFDGAPGETLSDVLADAWKKNRLELVYAADTPARQHTLADALSYAADDVQKGRAFYARSLREATHFRDKRAAANAARVLKMYNKDPFS